MVRLLASSAPGRRKMKRIRMARSSVIQVGQTIDPVTPSAPQAKSSGFREEVWTTQTKQMKRQISGKGMTFLQGVG